MIKRTVTLFFSLLTSPTCTGPGRGRRFLYPAGQGTPDQAGRASESDGKEI